MRVRIERLLEKARVDYRILEHAAVHSAAEAAALRGTPLRIGGKSLVLKLGAKTSFGVFVLSGQQRALNRPIRRQLGIQRLRFATRDELYQLTGLTPGCVPPFGRPIFDLPLYVDSALAESDRIAFSLGTHQHSVEMCMSDYLAVAGPTEVFCFSEDRTSNRPAG